MNDDISPICEKYKKYNVEYISEEQVIDDENNVLIMPEIWTQKLNNYSRIQKCIWWLSVCFYDGIKVDFWKKYIRSIFSALKHLNFDSFKYWKDRKNYKKIVLILHRHVFIILWGQNLLTIICKNTKLNMLNI